MIPKDQLENGIWYAGRCRNNYVALWDGREQQFYYLRHKFGWRMDTLSHFSDVEDKGIDGFVPLRKVDKLTDEEWKQIPTTY